MQSDMRNTRLYELLTILNSKHRKSIIHLAEEKLLTIKNKELDLLKEILKYIEDKKRCKAPLYKKHLAYLTEIPEGKLNHLTNSLANKINTILPCFGLMKAYTLENSYLRTFFFVDQELLKNTPLALKANKKVLETISNRTHDFHFYEMKHHEFCTKRNSMLEISGPELSNMHKSLDAFYAENKLKIFCEEINRTRILKEKANDSSNDSFDFFFLQMIEKKKFFDSPSVEIFFYIHKMLLTNSEESYTQTLKVLKKHTIQFHPDLEDTILRYMMNQSITLINVTKGKRKYIEHYVDYVDRLKKIGKLLLVNEDYPLRIFHNIVIASTKIKEKSWVINFVETEIKKLNTSNQENNKVIHLAHIELRNQNYQKAHDLIEPLENSDIVDIKAPKDDIFITLFYYQLCIQIYFKTKDDLLLAFQKNDALRKYVKRNINNLAISKKIGLDNFIAFTRRIIETPKYSTKWRKLEKDILKKSSQTLYTDSIYFMLNNKR